MPITQQDRNAAAALIEAYYLHDEKMLALAKSFRSGHIHGPWPSAFADHRQAALIEGVKPWKDAVLDELITCCILTDAHEADPRKALRDAIQWNVEAALDPRISEQAQALLIEGARRMQDKLADIVRLMAAAAVDPVIMEILEAVAVMSEALDQTTIAGGE